MVQTERKNFNIVIDENYPGLVKKGTEYIFDGNLKSDFSIEIRLDKKIYIKGSTETKKHINSIKGIKAEGQIKAGYNINIVDGDIESYESIISGMDIIVSGIIKANYCLEALGSIEAGKLIKSGWDIKAGIDIESGLGIESGENIRAGGNIKAAHDIRSDKRIEAGGSIEAGWGIRAALSVSCAGTLSAQYGIFAGVCTFKVIPTDENLVENYYRKVICGKLICGEVLHGILEEKES